MILTFKERLSLFGRYEVMNEREETVFRVEGEMAMLPRLTVYDAAGRELGRIKKEFALFAPTFTIYMGGRPVGEIRKRIPFMRPAFDLSMNGWRVEGNVWEFHYQLLDDAGRRVMTAEKKFLSFMDTYILDIPDPRNALMALMVVLAIDLAKESEGNG